VPGAIDLFSIREPVVRRKGIAHMLLNLTAVVVFALGFGLRVATEPGACCPSSCR
jgi:hypothetical protein